jgi:hypothetical protein
VEDLGARAYVVLATKGQRPDEKYEQYLPAEYKLNQGQEDILLHHFKN